MSALDLKGIVPATILPMTADYKPDFTAFQAYLEWLLEGGPVALAINMDTGEGPQLSPEERRQTLETASSVVGDRCPILAGVLGGSTLDAVENALIAKAAGADGLVIFPNAAFRNAPLDPEVPYHHHLAIAEATGLPIVLFQLASIFGGVLYTREVLLKLLEIPQVIALKESSFNAEVLAYTRETLDLADRSLFSQGTTVLSSAASCWAQRAPYLDMELSPVRCLPK
jgi:4-hydroxy-tetrahydrodipicolinate synthase